VLEDFRLIVDLVSVLAAAAVGGILAGLCRQPALLGYILGGMVVGPAGLGLLKELLQIETLAQFGAAFLLFALGVEFSFAEIKKVQGVALGGAALQIVLTITVTVVLCGVTGAWDTLPAKGVFLGAILSLSSTAVVLKSLMERNETSTRQGQVMLGILVVQDLALGLMLAVLPALNQPPEAIGLAVGQALLKIGLFAAGAFVVGVWIVPRLLRLLAKTESRELFLLGVVTLCLSIALLTEQLGLSIEMGAFVAGLMISEVEYADQTLTYVEPIRDIFAALFFATVGILIDPVFLWQNLELILGLVALVLLGKFLIVTPIVMLFRYPLKTAITVGLGLAQIGEFSFVLASEGRSLGLVSRRIYLLILGTTAVTLIITPFIFKVIPQLFKWAEGVPFLKPYFTAGELPKEVAIGDALQNHIVVCGYGRVGRNLVSLLQEHKYPLVAIDQSEAAIQKLREAKVPYVYGNAASLYVLEKAGVHRAKSLVISLPDPVSTRLTLKRALEIQPGLDIVVRAYNNRDIELFYQLGAKEVVQPEFEASLELTSHVLKGYGTPISVVVGEMQQIRNSHYLDLRPERSPAEITRDLKLAIEGLNGKWYTLPVDSPLVGMTIEEANLRWLTGVSLVALQRDNGTQIDYPAASTQLEAGDRCLVVGAVPEQSAFNQLVKGEIAIPTGTTPCQWLEIPSNSPVVGKKLSELHLRKQYGVQIQAIRRDGRFIRFPDGSADLQAGDRLLWCGGSYPLNQLQEWISPTLSTLQVPTIQVDVSEALQDFLPLDSQREH
jgi:monovalent cation:H+ antiporter-2, CPA2 family